MRYISQKVVQCSTFWCSFLSVQAIENLLVMLCKTQFRWKEMLTLFFYCKLFFYIYIYMVCTPFGLVHFICMYSKANRSCTLIMHCSFGMKYAFCTSLSPMTSSKCNSACILGFTAEQNDVSMHKMSHEQCLRLYHAFIKNNAELVSSLV